MCITDQRVTGSSPRWNLALLKELFQPVGQPFIRRKQLFSVQDTQLAPVACNVGRLSLSKINFENLLPPSYAPWQWAIGFRPRQFRNVVSSFVEQLTAPCVKMS
jgi:hypothetical protein